MTQETKTQLQVTHRETLGKKVKALRRSGFVPANIYGNGIVSTALQIPSEDLRRMMRAHGRTEIIYVQLDGEERPTFIKQVQRNPVTDEVLHIDFHQISLKDKIRIDVPLHFIGMSPAVDTYGAIVTHDLNQVVVEALPTNIPSSIEVDVSGLVEIGQSIHVSDLVAPEDSEIVSDPDNVVARTELPAAERAEEEEGIEGEEGVEGEEREEGEGAAEAVEEGSAEEGE